MRHPKEADEQKVAWAFLERLIIGGRPLADYSYHVPNGMWVAGNAKTRAQYMTSMKSQGFKAGVSDIKISYPVQPYHGAYIELKRKGARPSDLRQDQRDWLELMASVGYWVAVARGADEFISYVRQYLAKNEQPELDFWGLLQ